ncbi:MAG: hypothetical protein J0M26_24345 [Planctomycetes bacterium]|nr:hypothetical protein [Planctomycetota bacterium]
MQCNEFEARWQQRLDAGENPHLDEQLVAHSLTCAECNELLEGSEYLLAMPVLFASEALPTAEGVTAKHVLPPVLEPTVTTASPVTLPPTSMYRDASARWPNYAAVLVAVVALMMWGRVWMGLSEPQHTVASAHRAVEDSIAGANSPRVAAAATTPADVAPWVPSPLQLALRARETRYLLDNTDPMVLNGWRNVIWHHPPSSTEFWAEGLEPLTTSFELAVKVLRSTLPLNWNLSGKDSYDMWLSPLQ